METDMNAIAHLDFQHEQKCDAVEGQPCTQEARWKAAAPCAANCPNENLLLCHEHAGDLEAWFTQTAKVIRCPTCQQGYNSSSVKFVMLP